VAGNEPDRGGVRVTADDFDGDAKPGTVAGSGEGLPSRVRVYPGKNVTPTDEPITCRDLDPCDTALPGGVYVGRPAVRVAR
jgi:hypothetical protein